MSGEGGAGDAHALVGAWRLRSWESVAEDEPVALPMGSAPEGMLVYTPDGTMVVLIGAPGRQPFAREDLLQGSVEERSTALESFVAYGGSYSVQGDQVTHRVEMSLFPNWVGTVQRRTLRLTEDAEVLTLTSDPILVRGARRSQRLVWERTRHRAGGTQDE